MANTIDTRARRATRIRKQIASKDVRPRLSVYRSNKYIDAQIIDDTQGTTLVAATSKGQKGATYTERARATGKAIAEMAKQAGIERIVFDRNGYQYTGRVQALADGAREGGLQF